MTQYMAQKPMKNQEISRPNPQQKGRKSTAESGSVIFLILIAIALFAALSYVIAQSSRTGMGTASKEQAKLVATEIISFHNKMKDTIRILRVNGCSDTQINFQSSYWSDAGWYDNTTSPADKKCNVFEPQGGGIRIIDPPKFPVTVGTFHYQGQYFFPAGTAWLESGTTCTNDSCVDLLIGLNDIPKEVCTAINSMAGIEGMPTDSSWGGPPFKGTYTYNETLGESAASVSGKTFACMEHTNPGFRTFYSFAGVLIAR